MAAKTLTPDERFARLEDEIRRLRDLNARQGRELRTALQKQDTAEAIRKEIFGLAQHRVEPPKWLTKTGHVSGDRGVPCTLWSDWHFGEVVRPEEVSGLNEFNAEIAEARVKRLVNTTIDICRNHMGRGKGYPGIIVNIAGDMITGDIHDELMQTNDRTPQQQINDLTDIIAAALEQLAAEFGNLYVPCVPGNHGRDSKKPRMKGRVYTSHEWVIYTNLERHFRKSKTVHIHVTSETDIYYKVFGHRYLLTHGDSLGVKGGDGIIGAIGPIMRGSIKVGRSEAQVDREIDTILMGHWHQMLWLPNAIVNSSLKGYDEYARLALRAPYSRPSQALWFTHPEHGITARWEVFLEGQRDASSQNDWVSFEQRRTA